LASKRTPLAQRIRSASWGSPRTSRSGPMHPASRGAHPDGCAQACRLLARDLDHPVLAALVAGHPAAPFDVVDVVGRPMSTRSGPDAPCHCDDPVDRERLGSDIGHDVQPVLRRGSEPTYPSQR